MSQFSREVIEFWDRAFLTGEPLCRGTAFVLTVNPELSSDRRVMVLESVEGPAAAVVTPDSKEKLDLIRRPISSLEAFRRRLAEAGVTLHGADFVFYFREADKQQLLHDEPRTTRLIIRDDQSAFNEFQAAVSLQDQEAAYVELDHWAVFGAFDQFGRPCKEQQRHCIRAALVQMQRKKILRIKSAGGSTRYVMPLYSPAHIPGQIVDR
jgi:hypothetical protein